MERAQAQVKVAEERKRRKVSLALAGSVLLIMLLGSGGWLWIQRQEAERRAAAFRRETEQQHAVQAALDTAAELTRQARWQDAELILDQAAKEVSDGGQENLRQRLVQARRETRFLADLDKARLARARLTAENKLDYAASPVAYARAFKEFGLDVLQQTPEEIAEHFRALRPELRTATVLALDDWIFFVRDPKEKEQLLRIVMNMDDDPWRRRLRKTWEREALEALAQEVLRHELPATYLELLSWKLQGARKFGTAHQVLRRATDLYPSDFWAHFNLASLNEVAEAIMGQPHETMLEERIGHLRAALAIRPNAGFVYNDLGSALATEGDLNGALAAFRKATVLEPNDIMAHMNLSRSLRELGDLERFANA
jgi:tetratricopeptide (TPR) repeat protein